MHPVCFAWITGNKVAFYVWKYYRKLPCLFCNHQLLQIHFHADLNFWWYFVKLLCHCVVTSQWILWESIGTMTSHQPVRTRVDSSFLLNWNVYPLKIFIIHTYINYARKMAWSWHLSLINEKSLFLQHTRSPLESTRRVFSGIIHLSGLFLLCERSLGIVSALVQAWSCKLFIALVKLPILGEIALSNFWWITIGLNPPWSMDKSSVKLWKAELMDRIILLENIFSGTYIEVQTCDRNPILE